MKRFLGLCIVIGLLLAWVVPPTAAQDAAQNAVQAGTIWRCVEVNGQTSLNIRSAPSTSATIVSQRDPGEQFEADYDGLKSADGYNWVPVRYLDEEGWAITARLAPCENIGTDEPPTTTEGETVNHEVNEDGALDRFEIADIARSVVLIASIRGRHIEATGTGTITTPDGLIVTNAHVVEDSDEVAIGLLGDINDPPEYLYLGEVVSRDEGIDVALIAIRYDLDGHALDAAALDLPYIPASLGATEVYRGDVIYIFGYPAIGDDYLVVTSGSIVSVENGSVNGERIPVWYRTDAEIAPGNSGGLVVNGNGQFVGIPTFIQTEEETGGRLAGIRPAEVALLAVLEEGQGSGTVAQPETAPNTSSAVTVTPELITADHGAVVDGQTGITFHVTFSIDGWQERDATLSAYFFHDDLGSGPLTNPGGPSRYRGKDDVVMTSVAILPCCAETTYDDLPLFIPYSALGITQPGTYPLMVQIDARADDGSWHRTLSWEFVTYTRN